MVSPVRSEVSIEVHDYVKGKKELQGEKKYAPPKLLMPQLPLLPTPA
jgi:hypothetical protein